MNEEELARAGVMQVSAFYDTFKELFKSNQLNGKTTHEILLGMSNEALHTMFTSDLVRPEVKAWYLSLKDE